MKAKLVVTRVHGPEDYTSGLSDSAEVWALLRCGPGSPGHANLRTPDFTPVSELPSADCLQFGHADAQGFCKSSLKRLRKILGRPPQVGDEVVLDVEMKTIRNKEERKTGIYRLYPL